MGSVTSVSEFCAAIFQIFKFSAIIIQVERKFMNINRADCS